MLVAHRFPNVRKAAAEALYLKLLAAEELVSLVRFDCWRVTCLLVSVP